MRARVAHLGLTLSAAILVLLPATLQAASGADDAEPAETYEMRMNAEQMGNALQLLTTGMTIKMDGTKGVIETPLALLIFGLTDQHFKIPRGFGLSTVHGLTSSRVTLTLMDDHMDLLLDGFEEHGREISSPFGPSYDVHGLKITGQVYLAQAEDGSREFRVRDAAATAEVDHPRGLFAGCFLDRARSDFARMANEVSRDQVDAYFSAPAFQTAIRASLLSWAKLMTLRGWDGVDPTSLEMSNSEFSYRVFRTRH